MGVRRGVRSIFGVVGKGEVERGLRGRGVVGVDLGRRARGVLVGVSMCCGIGKKGGRRTHRCRGGLWLRRGGAWLWVGVSAVGVRDR